MFFHPEIIDAKYRQPIDEIIDNAIQLSPIDTRRGLYENIVLSGGSTLFPGLVPRLQRCLDERLEKRMSKYRNIQKSESMRPIKITVQQNVYQRYAVWQGGSILGGMATFPKMYHSREEYYEKGSKIARHNAVFVSGM